MVGACHAGNRARARMMISGLLFCAVLVVALGSSPRAQATAYGISGVGTNGSGVGNLATCSVNTVPCPSGDLVINSVYKAPNISTFGAFWSTTLDPNGSSGGYARFTIPFDALGYSTSDTSAQCAASPSSGSGGGAQWDQLIWDIQGAEADNLQSVVGFRAGSGLGEPAVPDPGYGTATAPFTNVTRAGWDYYCGVLDIMAYTRGVLGSNAPVEWEAFNEPDTFSPYNGALSGGCTSVNSPCGQATPNSAVCGNSNYVNCGPLEASLVWAMAQDAANNATFTNDHIAALTLSHAESGYVTYYLGQLSSLSNCSSGWNCMFKSLWPDYWSVHDYNDPTSAGYSPSPGNADLKAFENRLAPYYGTSAHPYGHVWVTEAAVRLDSPTTEDSNTGGSTYGCPDDDTNRPIGDPASNFGACVDNSSAAQYRGGQFWKALGNVTSSDGKVFTGEVFWFEFQLGTGIHAFDSAMVGDGGNPRPSFCAIIGSGTCNGDLADYQDPDGN